MEKIKLHPHQQKAMDDLKAGQFRLTCPPVVGNTIIFLEVNDAKRKNSNPRKS